MQLHLLFNSHISNDMKQYTHLTQEQRYQISALKKTTISNSEIARIIGCNKSTITRELKRNTGQRGYRPKQAQQLTEARKAKNNGRIRLFGWAYIQHLLCQKYSPIVLGFTIISKHIQFLL